MRSLCLMLFRFCSAAWVGAASLFVLATIAIARSPDINAEVTMQFTPVRFTVYYILEFSLLAVALAAVIVVLIRVGVARTVILAVRHTVAVDIALFIGTAILIDGRALGCIRTIINIAAHVVTVGVVGGIIGAIVARIAGTVVVGVCLTRVGVVGAVVAKVTDTVRVGIDLVFRAGERSVGVERTVIAHVADIIVVPVLLRRVGVVGAIVDVVV